MINQTPLEEAQQRYTRAYKQYRNAARAYAQALRDRHDGDRDDQQLRAAHISSKAMLDQAKERVSKASNAFLKAQSEEQKDA